MHQVGNHKADRICPPASQSARQHVGLVVQFLHPLQYAAPCLFADVGVATQYFRNSDNGDSKVVRNIFQPDSHTYSLGMIPHVRYKTCRILTRPSRIWCAARESTSRRLSSTTVIRQAPQPISDSSS